MKILGIAGSLRRDSYSKVILQTLAAELGEGVTMTVFPLDDVPLYNQDLDVEPALPGVAALRAAIAAADGLVIATPEYNHGIPGVLKNALDWASRPQGKAALTGKPVLTISSSPGGVGGARAHAQLNETLASIAARTILRPQSVLSGVHLKITDGKLTDRGSLDFLLAGIKDLQREARIYGVPAREAE